jgi:hypothetical protein
MTVQIIENFIPDDYAKDVIKKSESMLIRSPERPHFFEAFPGFPPSPFDSQNLLEVEKMNKFLDTSEKIMGASMISNAMYLAKLELEKFYNVTLNSYDGGLVKVIEGGSNSLHSDMYMLDGSKWYDGSGREDELEYSALLYLSSFEEDFTGGKIHFPIQDLTISPKRGMLVFFRGDLDHIHEVSRVNSGNRYAIIMFFGRGGSLQGREWVL